MMVRDRQDVCNKPVYSIIVQVRRAAGAAMSPPVEGKDLVRSAKRGQLSRPARSALRETVEADDRAARSRRSNEERHSACRDPFLAH
jgi:hypothetical protein